MVIHQHSIKHNGLDQIPRHDQLSEHQMSAKKDEAEAGFERQEPDSSQDQHREHLPSMQLAKAHWYPEE